MYARESFTIAEVADLLSIRRLSDSYQDDFRWMSFLWGFKRKMQFLHPQKWRTEKCLPLLPLRGSRKHADTVCGTYPAFTGETGIK